MTSPTISRGARRARGREAWFFLCGVCALCGGLFGCSKEAASPAATAAPPPSASAERGHRIEGKVPPPAAGVPVIIVLESKTAREFPPQAGKPAMDQAGATFTPAMLFVRSGQPTEFRNSDDTLHNVHVTHEETREPQFNVAIPTGETYQYTFKREGFYHVGCDIHPAMSAEIFASASPYVAVAERDGRFAFEDVEPGAYVAIVFAGAKRTEREVTVGTGVTSISIEE